MTEACLREGNRNLLKSGTKANQDDTGPARFGVTFLDFCSGNHQPLSEAEGSD